MTTKKENGKNSNKQFRGDVCFHGVHMKRQLHYEWGKYRSKISTFIFPVGNHLGEQ